MEKYVSPFCIYARTTYTETVINAWWSQGMTRSYTYHSREYHHNVYKAAQELVH